MDWGEGKERRKEVVLMVGRELGAEERKGPSSREEPKEILDPKKGKGRKD